VRFAYNYNRLRPNVAFPRTNVAAVVGGVVGGVVGLLALLGLAFFCFRRRRRQQLQTLNERPNPLFLPQPEARFTNAADGANIDPFASSAALSASRPSGTSRPLQSWTDSETGSSPNLAARDASNPSPMTNFSHTRATLSVNDSATPSVPVSIGVVAAATTPQVSYPNEKSRPVPSVGVQQDPTAGLDVPSARPNAILTDDQADFVNSLFNNNVPAPVVARVLERMIANPQGATITGLNDPELRAHLNPGDLTTLPQAQAGGVPWQPTLIDIGDGETTVGTAPPSYDYARAQ
jgi:MYXO-CTERM domain-containing protein